MCLCMNINFKNAYMYTCTSLAHLSQRLVGELYYSIGRQLSSVRSSLSTFSNNISSEAMKLILTIFHIKHLQAGGTNYIVFCPNRIRPVVAMAAYSWKNENWHLLLSHCRYFDKFYRNVPQVGLYKTYLFCCDRLIWLVTMATKKQNLRK